MDLHAHLDAPITLQANERRAVPTGLFLEIPHGFEGQVRPRSGLAIRKGLTVLNTPGTIDSDYRGELLVILINLGEEAITIEPKERIAQLVICPIARATLTISESLSTSDRGEGRFGHTGSN